MAMSNLTYLAGMTALGFMGLVVVAMVYVTLASARNDRHSPLAEE